MTEMYELNITIRTGTPGFACAADLEDDPRVVENTISWELAGILTNLADSIDTFSYEKYLTLRKIIDSEGFCAGQAKIRKVEVAEIPSDVIKKHYVDALTEHFAGEAKAYPGARRAAWENRTLEDLELIATETGIESMHPYEYVPVEDKEN